MSAADSPSVYIRDLRQTADRSVVSFDVEVGEVGTLLGFQYVLSTGALKYERFLPTDHILVRIRKAIEQELIRRRWLIDVGAHTRADLTYWDADSRSIRAPWLATLTPHTAHDYHVAVGDFLRSVRPHLLREVTATDIATYCDHVRSRIAKSEIKSSTAVGYKTGIASFLRFAERQHIVSSAVVYALRSQPPFLTTPHKGGAVAARSRSARTRQQVLDACIKRHQFISLYLESLRLRTNARTAIVNFARFTKMRVLTSITERDVLEFRAHCIEQAIMRGIEPHVYPRTNVGCIKAMFAFGCQLGAIPHDPARFVPSQVTDAEIAHIRLASNASRLGPSSRAAPYGSNDL